MFSNENKLRMIVFIFDTGKIERSFYGDVIFEKIIKGTEISRNSHKVVFSLGDILDKNAYYDDIAPFIIKDEICTIKKGEHYESDLYGVLLEDIETKIAIEIDNRLKSEFLAYVGMSSVNVKSSDMRKQFWKCFIRSFNIKGKKITSFGNNEEYNSFGYDETANKFGFEVVYDGIENYWFDEEELYCTRQSTFIQFRKQLKRKEGENDSDRGRVEMSRALARETQTAGVMIWKAMEDINLARIPHQGAILAEYVPSDYVFTSLYQASQGIERLLKVAIQLMMYNSNNDSDKILFEKLLYSHNHSKMIDFIEENEDFKIKQSCKNFVTILFKFYANARYNRFKSSNDDKLEMTLFRNLGKGIDSVNFDDKIKHQYGRRLGETARALFKLITELSMKLNIYVYEISNDTNANYVLSSHYNVDIYRTLKGVKRAKREMLWYLVSKGISPELEESLELHTPLKFEDDYTRKELTDILVEGANNNALFDFVSYVYGELVSEDKKLWHERMEFLDFITNRYDYVLDDCDDMFDNVYPDEK